MKDAVCKAFAGEKPWMVSKALTTKQKSKRGRRTKNEEKRHHVQIELAAHALLGGGIVGCDRICIVGSLELGAALSRVVGHGRRSVDGAWRDAALQAGLECAGRELQLVQGFGEQQAFVPALGRGTGR